MENKMILGLTAKEWGKVTIGAAVSYVFMWLLLAQ